MGFDASGNLIGWLDRVRYSLTVRESVQFDIVLEEIWQEINCDADVDMDGEMRWKNRVLNAIPDGSSPENLLHAYHRACEERAARNVLIDQIEHSSTSEGIALAGPCRHRIERIAKKGGCCDPQVTAIILASAIDAGLTSLGA